MSMDLQRKSPNRLRLFRDHYRVARQYAPRLQAVGIAWGFARAALPSGHPHNGDGPMKPGRAPADRRSF